MKKDNLLLAFMIIAFAGSLYLTFFKPVISENKDDNQNTSDIVYTDEYQESIRQNVIYELYGSRDSYASEKTGSRADYVDKEASKDGELVVEEDRMQQVYDSKLEEFDAMIDNEKVDEIVNERLEQLVNEGAYNEVAKSNESTNRRVMYWKNGGKYYALLVETAMILYILYRKIRSKKE